MDIKNLQFKKDTEENLGLDLSESLNDSKWKEILSKQLGEKSIENFLLSEKKKLIIGVVTNYEPDDISIWVNSALKTGAKIAMLVYNAKQSMVDYLKKNGIEIWAVSRANEEKQKEGWVFYYKDMNDFNVCQDRFYHLWLMLVKLNKIDDQTHVILTDTKDVVFQHSPFVFMKKWFEQNPDKSILLSSEGLTYENEDWGKNNAITSFGNDIYKLLLAKKEIANAGVIAGILDKSFVDLLFSVYMLSRSATTMNGHVAGGGGADQAALNILENQVPWQLISGKPRIVAPWVLNAGTTNDPTKRHYVDKLLGLPAIFKSKENMDEFNLNSGICNKLNEYYPIVHQYDRIPEWKEYFKEEFSNEN